MAYSLPLWRPTIERAEQMTGSPSTLPPPGYVNPTDAKRYLSGYFQTLPGFNEAWRQYMPSFAGFLEGSIPDISTHMPADVWSQVSGWYNSLPANQKLAGWGAANPLGELSGGGYYWMAPEWWKSGQNAVNTYMPPPPPPPDTTGSHKDAILDNIMQGGVMGRTSPGQHSGLGIAPAALPQLPNLEQPIQGTLNQWNTMPQWNMGTGPTWGNF